MTKKILRSMFSMAFVILVASFLILLGALYSYFTNLQADRLRSEMNLAAYSVSEDGISYLENLQSTDFRLTWIGADGSVLYDTHFNAEEMENHSQREEIQSAFATGEGESSRYSSTLTEKNLYYAKLLEDGTVLRISTSYAAVPMLVLGLLPPFVLVFGFALVLAAILSKRLSDRIVAPLNDLNFDEPLENNTYDELSPMLVHMEQQRRQITQQLSELKKQQNEFAAVTKDMKEGLVLLNEQERILSINAAAMSFLEIKDAHAGEDFLVIERNREIDQLLQKALQNGSSEGQISKHGSIFQLNASRIMADDKTSGVVLLIFDVTEKVFAERNRREFTANVSHELKTPLHAIMGSAELLESGLVKTEDIPRFVGQIRTEADRLLSLIEDIIRLSQLDEKRDLPMETLRLDEIAKKELDALSTSAAAHQVTLSLEAKEITLYSSQQLLHEIISNLCENAIKYNHAGGKVTVTLEKTDALAMITVTDTGIGIPLEDQARVFERFYRVDKSHSKETDGTGLGLSIVKHAVEYLGGTIHLTSTVGKGSQIRVTLPLNKK